MQPRKPAAEEFDSIDAMSPADALDAIQDVVDDVDQYVLDWFKRLNDGLVVDTPAAATTDRELRARIKEFREEKRQWEAKREVEQHELQEKMRQLTDAWLRLEDEQRLLLQRRESPGSAKEKSKPRESSARLDRTPSTARMQESARVPESTERAVHHGNQEADRRVSSPSTTNNSFAPPAQPRAAGIDRDASRSAARVAKPDDAAVRQFQQLRREIESSRPQRGLG